MVRVYDTAEDKFKKSLYAFNEVENRPFMRESLDEKEEAMVRARQQVNIDALKRRVAEESGVDPSQVHLWCSKGPAEYIGPVVKRVLIKEDEESDQERGSAQVAEGYFRK